MTTIYPLFNKGEGPIRNAFINIYEDHRSGYQWHSRCDAETVKSSPGDEIIYRINVKVKP